MTVDQDIRYIQSAAESLEEFLLSDEIFYPLSGIGLMDHTSTRLSLGMLDLCLARLSAVNIAPNLQNLYVQQKEHIERIRTHWKSAWARKAVKELRSRLHLWQNYLDDTFREKDPHTANYKQEVRQRVVIELLYRDTDSLSLEDDALLTNLDRRLKVNLVPGEFIWDPELAPAFPRERFWFLYGHLKG